MRHLVVVASVEQAEPTASELIDYHALLEQMGVRTYNTAYCHFSVLAKRGMSTIEFMGKTSSRHRFVGFRQFPTESCQIYLDDGVAPDPTSNRVVVVRTIVIKTVVVNLD